jgi:hypothetical protein
VFSKAVFIANFQIPFKSVPYVYMYVSQPILRYAYRSLRSFEFDFFAFVDTEPHKATKIRTPGKSKNNLVVNASASVTRLSKKIPLLEKKMSISLSYIFTYNILEKNVPEELKIYFWVNAFISLFKQKQIN